MDTIVFKGPFSMPIMEDSTNLSDTVVQEVINFALNQYGIKLDEVKYSISYYAKLDDNNSNHQYNTSQELIIKKINGKNIGHLVIKTRLKFN